jgi:hypothetical protein
VIRIELDRPKVTTGDFVTGRAHWSSEDDRRAHHIAIALEWQTDGEGNVAHGAGRSMRVTPRGDAREATVPFRFMIPFEGPISFDTELIKMRWMVRVRIERTGFDEFGEAVFRVEPRSRTRRTSASEPALPASA